MNETKSNIETIARALCEQQLLAMAVSDKDAAAGVDRYWHCVAADIEAGLIDTAGNRLVPFDFDTSQNAYRDWCLRHP